MDPFTIAASPNFGSIWPNSSFRMASHLSRYSNLGLDTKAPLLEENERPQPKQSFVRFSHKGSFMEKSTICRQFTGEFIGEGCTLMQTVFNGK